MKKNILSFLRIFLLLLFVGYYSNITFFYHSHRVNGTLIFHSHWFKDFRNDIPVQSHSHTSLEYVLIDTYNKTVIDNDLLVPVVSEPVVCAYRIENILLLEEAQVKNCLHTNPRAPPAC
ncbi:MAG: hypothetical protein LUG18_14535 [Candidatus Azobacteroides sp.]|nr:hypothetical protein [Candidatus Azobacteroides sp.]